MTDPLESQSTVTPVVRRTPAPIQPEERRLPTLHRVERRKRPSRWLFGVLALVAVVAIGLALLREGAQPVELGTVTRGIVSATIDAEGTTRIVHRHAIVAPVAGTLARISVRAGDAVKVGDVLAELTPAASALFDPRSAAQAEARVGSTRALLAQAEATASRASLARSQAARDLERTRRLEQAGAISRQQLEQVELLDAEREADMNAAKSAVRVAEHELLAARAAVSGGARDAAGKATVVRAPMSGLVLRVVQEDEGVVAAGTPLLDLGDPASMEVVTDVLSEDATRLRLKALAWVATGSDTVPAAVTRIEPKAFTKRSSLGVDEQRVRVVLETTAPTSSMLRLGDAFRVDVVLETSRTSDTVVTAPAGALLRQGSGWSVFTMVAGKARLVPVVLGLRSATSAEIRSGLNAGDRVILFPSDQVTDGRRVVERDVRSTTR